ncbi:hypothetical protein EDD85DRAFT_603811 [Armillaria nabsnona]|nr:hypothetical protein EDD85DRAFT_603811 [Armillaria nabsnona]
MLLLIISFSTWDPIESDRSPRHSQYLHHLIIMCIIGRCSFCSVSIYQGESPCSRVTDNIVVLCPSCARFSGRRLSNTQISAAWSSERQKAHLGLETYLAGNTDEQLVVGAEFKTPCLAHYTFLRFRTSNRHRFQLGLTSSGNSDLDVLL